ncbi:hypothetical protein GUY60_34195 [Streptomyces sp. YC537]|uniref:Mce-associated membrane protein n=1 Tax=Streptomyces boluensis TaxID=1775135 RepID=A0A964UX98_9ACTN|nr:hypothetical protein [Streptomyces boluensis]
MANTGTRGRGTGPGSPARHSLAAAARAAAKRSDGGRGGSQDPLAGTPEDLVNDRTGLPAVEKVVGKVLHAPVPEGEDAADASRRGRRRARLAAAFAVLTVVGLVAVTVLGLQYQEGQRVQEARAEALRAARAAAPVVLSYDYRHLEKDFAGARSHLTGSFRAEYGRTTRTVVAPTARKYKGVVKASVVAPPDGGAPAASVASATADRAVVLIFVNQVTKSTQVSGSRMDLNRVRMSLTRTPDGWKVSAVDAL